MYQWDVFISYPQREPVLGWMRNFFHPELEQWLDVELPAKPSIFRDERAMTPGTIWPDALREALLHARVVVAVLSPQYFRSEWCLAEWKSMREREQLLALRTPSVPRGLIYPVRFHDGDHFDADAKAMQLHDMSRWNFNAPAYAQTAAYVDFQAEMKKLAAGVATMLHAAPPWQANWPCSMPTPGPAPVIGVPKM